MADYLIPEPQEIIDGTSVTKIYQMDENKWWCALKPKDSKYKWWAIGAMVSNTDRKNVPIIISNIKENCNVGRVTYDSYLNRYKVSNYTAYQVSFDYSGKTLYCSVPDMVAVTDNKLDSLVPILSGSYDMTNKDVIISVAKIIVGNYIDLGGAIPSVETIETDGTYQTSWVRKLINNVWTKTFAFAHAKTVYTDFANKKTLADKLVEIDISLDGKANSTHTHTKSQITDFPTSMPASDVYSWAKASSKPSYTASEVGAAAASHTHAKSEVGLGNVDNTADSAKSVKYATSAGSASSASKATGVVDYGSTAKTIQIGYSGDGISGDAIKYIAGYTTGNGSDVNAKIKDVSKDALKSWLGLGSLAYSSATIPTIPSSLPANGGNSSTVNGHTVKSDVPENAVFTDTVYDDTEIQQRISDNGYGEVAGGKNLAKSYKIGTTAEKYYTALSVDANLQPSTTYTISFIGASNYIGYANEFIFITAEQFTCNGERQSITLTTKESLPEDQRVYPGWLFFKNFESNTVMPSFTDVQIELGSEATSYEPYFSSNKMLAEENAQQSTEMMDIKMLGWSVPKECPIQNEVNGNQFTQKVGRVDLGSLDWGIQTTGDDFFYSTDISTNLKKQIGYTENWGYCVGYSIIKFDKSTSKTKVIFADNVGNIFVRDTRYTTEKDLQTALHGVYLYYELATPITTTIDGNEIGETVSDVRKEITVNLLKPTLETTTKNGITCTNNGDGTYTLDGTASANTWFTIETGIVLDGTYKIIAFLNPTRNCYAYIGDTKQYFTNYDKPINTVNLENQPFVIQILSGTTLSNVIAKPMITTNLSATYDDFVPYTGDTGKLNSDVANLCTDYGKGFIINKFVPYYNWIESGSGYTGRTTINGVTYIIEPDGSIKIEGTPAITGDLYEATRVGFFKASEVKGLKLIGCQGGSVDTYFVGATTSTYLTDDEIGNALKDTGNGVILNFSDTDEYVYVFIASKVGVTIPSNTYIKLMLTDNYKLTYKDYVPYVNFGALVEGERPSVGEYPPTISGFSNNFVSYLLNILYRMSRNLVVRSITVTNDPYDTLYSYDEDREEYKAVGDIYVDGGNLVVPDLLINGSKTPAILSDITFNIAGAIEDTVTTGGITRECIQRTMTYRSGSLTYKAIKLSGTATEDVVIPIYTISNPKVSKIYFRGNSSFSIFASTPTQTGKITSVITLTKKEPVTFYVEIPSGTKITATKRYPMVYASYSSYVEHSDVSPYHLSDDASTLVEILDTLKNSPTINKSMTVGTGLEDHVIGDKSFTSGDVAQAIGYCSFATGDHPVSLGANSQSLGCYVVAKANQCAIGHFNSVSSDASAMYGTSGTAFYVGNGTEYTRSNAFRVDYNGTPYSKAGLNTTGADYAEFFEWDDENPDNDDRRGYFVTLVGKKIKIAKEGDYILGVVSGFPAIIGNGDEEWKGRYVFDDFGCPVIEEFEYEEEVPEVITNEDGEEEVITKKVKKTGTKWKEVPEYDPERPYVQRSERQEWSAVGMLGVLSVIDDGTCEVNGFCKVTDEGTATSSDTGYRVVKRVTDNIVEVIFK